MNLMTVPSCDKHNTSKSDSDEYARNLFTMSTKINEVGHNHGLDKSMRSISKSRKEIEKYFRGSTEVVDNDKITRRILIDKYKISDYFNGLAYGLYRKTFEKNYEGYWYIHLDFDIPISGKHSSLDNAQKRVAKALREIEFKNFLGENPEVFKYSYYTDARGLTIFKLVFYDGAPVFIGEKKIFFPKEHEDYIED